MRKITNFLLASLLFLLTSKVGAQGLDGAYHTPDPAYANNAVTLHLYGWLPNECWDDSHSFWFFNGNVLTVYVEFQNCCPLAYCVPDIDGWTRDIPVGTLAAATYQVVIYGIITNYVQYLGSYQFTVYSSCQTPSPAQLTVSPLGCSYATLNCQVPGVDGYGFRYKPTNSSSWITTDFTPLSYLNLTNLFPLTQYEFQARVWCGSSPTNWSASKYFITCQNGTGVCSNPFIVACGNTYSGNNASGANNYNAYSGNGISFTQMYGPEVFYQFTFTQGGPLSLSLTGLAVGQDLDLILLSSCNSNAIVAASGNAGNSSEYINLNYLPAGAYRIVVDGWNYAVSNYTLSVQCGNSCAAPLSSQLFATDVTTNSARINCSYQGASLFDWRYRVAGGGAWVDLSAGNLNYADLFALLPYTTYEFQCSVYCNGSWTSWSASQFFTTTIITTYPDEPCGATTLNPGTNCSPVSGSNVVATTSWYPPPPAECNTYNMKDVWYKVQIPATGKVKISTFAGSMTDAVVAFYYGSCNNLTPGAPTCFDDTNGNLMPQVTITSPPGTWWYIRLWGYDGTVGTFSICAQTMYSLMEDEFTVRDGEDGGNRSLQINAAIDPGKAAQANVGAPSIRIFPVPAQDEITVATTLEAEREVTVQIIDLAGQLVKEETLAQAPAGAFETRLDVGSLPAGAYLLRFRSDGRETTGKFIKL